MIAPIFNANAELAIPVGTPSNEANAETAHLLTAETKIKNLKSNLKPYTRFDASAHQIIMCYFF